MRQTSKERGRRRVGLGGGGGGGGLIKTKPRERDETQKRRGSFHVVYPCTVPKSTLLSR